MIESPENLSDDELDTLYRDYYRRGLMLVVFDWEGDARTNPDKRTLLGLFNERGRRLGFPPVSEESVWRAFQREWSNVGMMDGRWLKAD